MAEEQGDMKKRLVRFATEHLGITVHRFEKSCGLSNSYCSNPNMVGSYAQKKISVAYPELNMGWVITGNGLMLSSESAGEEIDEKLKNVSRSEIVGDVGVNNLLKEEVSTLKKELELYKMLYQKEHEEVKAMSEKIGALKAELNLAKKEGNKQKLEYSNAEANRKVS